MAVLKLPRLLVVFVLGADCLLSIQWGNSSGYGKKIRKKTNFTFFVGVLVLSMLGIERMVVGTGLVQSPKK